MRQAATGAGRAREGGRSSLAGIGRQAGHGERPARVLGNFTDAGGANDRGFLLPLRELFRSPAIDIRSGELQAVEIEDGDFPMAMFASGVTGALSWFAHWFPLFAEVYLPNFPVVAGPALA